MKQKSIALHIMHTQLLEHIIKYYVYYGISLMGSKLIHIMHYRTCSYIMGNLMSLRS